MNAFESVKEFGLGVGIRLDYREGSQLVLADELETGLRRLMEGEDEVNTIYTYTQPHCCTSLTNSYQQ